MASNRPRDEKPSGSKGSVLGKVAMFEVYANVERNSTTAPVSHQRQQLRRELEFVKKGSKNINIPELIRKTSEGAVPTTTTSTTSQRKISTVDAPVVKRLLSTDSPTKEEQSFETEVNLTQFEFSDPSNKVETEPQSVTHNPGSMQRPSSEPSSLCMDDPAARTQLASENFHYLEARSSAESPDDIATNEEPQSRTQTFETAMTPLESTPSADTTNAENSLESRLTSTTTTSGSSGIHSFDNDEESFTKSRKDASSAHQEAHCSTLSGDEDSHAYLSLSFPPGSTPRILVRDSTLPDSDDPPANNPRVISSCYAVAQPTDSVYETAGSGAESSPSSVGADVSQTVVRRKSPQSTQRLRPSSAGSLPLTSPDIALPRKVAALRRSRRHSSSQGSGRSSDSGPDESLASMSITSLMYDADDDDEENNPYDQPQAAVTEDPYDTPSPHPETNEPSRKRSDTNVTITRQVRDSAEVRESMTKSPFEEETVYSQPGIPAQVECDHLLVPSSGSGLNKTQNQEVSEEEDFLPSELPRGRPLSPQNWMFLNQLNAPNLPARVQFQTDSDSDVPGHLSGNMAPPLPSRDSAQSKDSGGTNRASQDEVFSQDVVSKLQSNQEAIITTSDVEEKPSKNERVRKLSDNSHDRQHMVNQQNTRTAVLRQQSMVPISDLAYQHALNFRGQKIKQSFRKKISAAFHFKRSNSVQYFGSVNQLSEKESYSDNTPHFFGDDLSSPSPPPLAEKKTGKSRHFLKKFTSGSSTRKSEEY